MDAALLFLSALIGFPALMLGSVWRHERRHLLDRLNEDLLLLRRHRGQQFLLTILFSIVMLYYLLLMFFWYKR
ncbi:hypothetical protein ACE6H2_010097 [Prunus campanulata]